MPNAIVTLPDGKRAKVSFDSPEQLDATVADLVTHHSTTDSGGRPGHVRGVNDVITEAIGEPALKMATGAVGAIAGGVAGIARGVGAGGASLAQGEGLERARQAFTEEAASTIEKTGEALTRQPRTKVGQATSKAVEYPFQLLAQGANVAGEKTAEVTGSPALGAAVNTVIQAGAPLAVAKGAGALTRATRGAAAAQESAAAPRTPPGQPPASATPAAPPEPLTASGAPRQPPTDVGGPVPRGTAAGPAAPPLSATGAPRGTMTEPPGEVPPARPSGRASGSQPQSEARAKAYAERIGLDWARLGAGTRQALTTIAQDSTALERLNPEAVKRQAHLQDLRVPVGATRGQLERDPVQLRREAIASNTTEGQPIRDVDIAANRDLQANLEVLRGRVGGQRGSLREGITESGAPDPTSIRAPTKVPTQVGEVTQTAAREKAKWSRKGYDALYKIARETEPTAEAGLKPITDLLTENPDIQHLGWVQSWLSKARSVKDLAPDQPLERVTLNELDDLRKLAGKHGQGTDAHFAGELRKAVDTAMEDVPEGATAWKRARDAFKAHQAEFKDQGIVRNLVSQKKGGADRALALEKTWKRVATGTVDEIRQVKKTLMTGGTPATRMAGRKAWRDLRAETVNRILEDARNVTGADETERAILTEAALRRSINRIPRENLEELLGKANVRELMNILRARRITTRSPVGGRTTQSGTIPNALVLFEKVLKHIPGGKYVVGAKHAISELGERGASARAAQEATVSPLEQAARDVERTSRQRSRRAIYETLESSGPTLPQGPPPQPLPIGPALNPAAAVPPRRGPP